MLHVSWKNTMPSHGKVSTVHTDKCDTQNNDLTEGGIMRRHNLYIFARYIFCGRTQLFFRGLYNTYNRFPFVDRQEFSGLCQCAYYNPFVVTNNVLKRDVYYTTKYSQC